MPFKSEAQRKFLWAKHPEIAEKWAHKYGTPKKLPKHAQAVEGLKKAAPK